MNLSLSYLTEPKEFAQASFIFIETKPILKFLVRIVNVAVVLILALLLIKGLKVGLIPQEWFMVTMTLLWLFFRRKFNRWIFFKKFNKQAFAQQTLHIHFSRNGITWSGEKFTKGDAHWSQIKYVLQLKNGFIFAISATQFLWLPERVFNPIDQKQELINLIKEMNVKIKTYPQWSC
jgi:hypothetical protein